MNRIGNGLGPFCHHNFLVGNFEHVCRKNNLSSPTLVRIFPVVGEKGSWETWLATGVWWSIFILMIVIWFTGIFGIIAGVFLELYVLFCLITIIYNWYKFGKVKHFIKGTLPHKKKNDFYEIRTTIDECAAFIAETHRRWLTSVISTRTSESTLIMVYTTRYTVHRVIIPLVELVVCAILIPVFMAQ